MAAHHGHKDPGFTQRVYGRHVTDPMRETARRGLEDEPIANVQPVASKPVVSRDLIISEIRRLAEAADGQAPGKGRFTRETGITESSWAGRYWVNWGDALVEAGFSPNEYNQAHPEEHLLRQLAMLCRELGHFPVQREMRMQRRIDATFPSSNTFSRFGNKSQVVARLVEFCDADPELDDVADICRPLLAVDSHREGVDVRAVPETSHEFVYLFKSGKYYKVGKSNSPGRRQYELDMQTPELVTEIHKIRTDDPFGIEAYWHRRFADRQHRNEWFLLTPADVAAFKRRTFM